MYTRILTLLLFHIPSFLYALDLSPSDSTVLHGMDLCICEQYQQAAQVFDSLVTAHPEHPAGYFFKAAVIQSRMLDFETIIGSAEFYTEIQRAIELAEEQVATHPDNALAWFYLGGAKSYYSYQLAREKSYLKAIRSGLKSINDLEKSLALDPSSCDALLGIGSYEYWRSYLTRKFAWLPFFSDNREQGIAKLEQVLECGSFSRWAAMSNLAWIFIEEKQYDQTIAISEKGLQNFPNSRFFLWPLGDALYKNKEYYQAADIYKRILTSVTNESFNNHYNEIVLNLKLGQCYHDLGELQTAVDYLQTSIELEPAKEVEKRGREKQDEAAKLLAEISKKL